MSRALGLLTVLFLLLFPAYAMQVAVTPSPIIATVTKSEPVTQFTASITLDTNDIAVAVTIPNNQYVGILGPTYITTSGTYQYTLVVYPIPGTYSGTLRFVAVGTGATYDVSFSITVSAWEKKYSDYFAVGEMYKVTVGNNDYLLKVKNVTADTADIYFDGLVYTLARGDSEVLTTNLKVTLTEIFSSGVVLEFYTDGADVSVAPYTGTTATGAVSAEDLSGFHFLISKYSKYIQEGMTYTVTVTLINDTDYRVYLKDIYFENTTVTEEGEKPTRLEDYQLPSYLDPGQELTLKVTIDTRGLEVGKTYTPTLIALGRVGDQDVRSQIDFYITVVKSVQTGTAPTQPTQPTRPTQPTQTLKTMIIETVPQTPNPGDTVMIYVRDAKTQEYINATVTVNGQQQSTFTADWCQTYRISATAEGYAPATKTIQTKCKTMNVTYTPTKPVDGEEVRFSVTDAETGEPVQNVSIRIDGLPITGLVWTAKEGSHTVVVTAPGYSNKSLVINVSKPPVTLLSQLPSTVETEEQVTIELSREATWEIYDQNNVLVASGTGTTILFSPKEPGEYTVKADGKVLGTFLVEGQQAPIISIPSDLLYYVAGIGVLLVIYDIIKKRRKKKKAAEDVGFELRPKMIRPLTEQQEGGSES